MDQNNFRNFNGNEATFTSFSFEYSAPESVQLERNENFAMVAESFTHDSNNKNINITTTTQSNPVDDFVISPPFPPNIDPKVLALELFNKGGKRTKKMLNEFFLFRKEFVAELKRQNLRPRQTKVSSLASTSWHKQKPSVKDEYRRLAREVERLFMIERQREANEVSRAELNESSTDDSVPSPTEPVPQLPLPLSNPSSNNNISSLLETNNQNNNVKGNYLPSSNYQDYLSWPYNQYIRPNVTPVTSSYRPFTTNYFHHYVDQVVVPSQNSHDYFTQN